MAQPQMMVQPPPDPVLQAIIDSDFKPVNLKLGGPDGNSVLSGANSEEADEENGLDFTRLNRLTKLLATNQSLRCPPPPTVVSQKLSQVINGTKEEGNTMFKAKKYELALQRYTMAASIAVQRPLWESNQVMREELATVLSNRSVTFLEAGDFLSALVDAEHVINLKRQWNKGHFRKAKALIALHEYEEARDAVKVGLQFEPNNTEMLNLLESIEKLVKDSQS
ncbi:hypothetical protein BJ322DRAFT_1020805 [Thelephora terrestris]|uniref:Uncharacterized protein n=1 Tax=Thelephora terrestris TaxID=56493 RepID=A0A9P6HEA4_9AGAM|nr:hypothetical protein BJ322DRAFT_1020805 [Thelephora terrestris]